MPPSTIYTGENRLLAAVPREDFARFFTGLCSVDLQARQVLQDSERPIEHVFFMEEGVASILALLSDGSAVEVGMIGNEGMVGVTSMLAENVPMPHVTAQIAGRALRMRVAQCRKAFDESEAVRRLMLGFAYDLMRLSSRTAACNRMHSIEQRCARWLLVASDRAQSETISITHQLLATMLGVRRAGITVTAGDLQRSGLISYHHGKITLRNREALETHACECYQQDQEQLMRLL